VHSAPDPFAADGADRLSLEFGDHEAPRSVPTVGPGITQTVSTETQKLPTGTWGLLCLERRSPACVFLDGRSIDRYLGFVFFCTVLRCGGRLFFLLPPQQLPIDSWIGPSHPAALVGSLEARVWVAGGWKACPKQKARGGWGERIAPTCLSRRQSRRRRCPRTHITQASAAHWLVEPAGGRPGLCAHDVIQPAAALT
jgi:hypothetical protein